VGSQHESSYGSPKNTGQNRALKFTTEGRADLRLVFLLPFTLCCWGDANEPIEFHAGSRLIAFQGERNEKGPGTWYYQIDDKKGWVVVREVPRPPLGQG
jgi:hypothetical protein